MHIVWLDETGNSLGEADYAVSDILPKELERYNIVRALHRMPKWEKLPYELKYPSSDECISMKYSIKAYIS